MDVLQWLDYLNEVVENATEIPITGKIVLHKKDMLELIKKILHALPDELKRSKWIISERDRIIGEAKKFSEEAIKDAKLRIEKEVEEHDIVIEARNKAKSIIDIAKGEAKAIRCGANDYVKEVLKSLVEDMENNRKSFVETLEKINSKNVYDMSELYKDISERVKADLDKIK
ncbi:ATPase [Candidatus Arthromitus sp. SFB-turkey]|uniref:ATPase n=1 Tax=Candidatus Arthromitus sp. SFB-turkey TaxID=1840217 RepID=UPI0007F3C75F|nr:ATPase [Candidatus Arthromitus sp. SFB-turkey]OAT87890.1 ATPase [Candidatus Arthromitus sp. SFB-turkey]HJD00572.1 ATPase [Candidatus Dwaynia gallinarum]